MFEEKVTADAAAWVFNVVSSVAIVFANKVLMDPKWGFKFVFGETDRMHRESVCMGIGYHVQLANGLPSSQQQPCAPCTSSRRQLWSRALSCWDLALGPVCRCMVSLENTVEVCIHVCIGIELSRLHLSCANRQAGLQLSGGNVDSIAQSEPLAQYCGLLPGGRTRAAGARLAHLSQCSHAGLEHIICSTPSSNCLLSSCQVSKLLIIPFVCLAEFAWLRRGFKSSAIAVSILVVIAGVSIV